MTAQWPMAANESDAGADQDSENGNGVMVSSLKEAGAVHCGSAPGHDSTIPIVPMDAID